MHPDPAPRPLRVLVVDVGRNQVDLLCQLLQGWGHEAAAAYSGPEAIELAAVGVFDVVLLDLAMPDVDGLEVARWVRVQAGTDHALLVAVTDHADERASQVGFDAYLIKPVQPDDLARLLDAVRAGGDGMIQGPAPG